MHAHLLQTPGMHGVGAVTLGSMQAANAPSTTPFRTRSIEISCQILLLFASKSILITIHIVSASESPTSQPTTNHAAACRRPNFAKGHATSTLIFFPRRSCESRLPKTTK